MSHTPAARTDKACERSILSGAVIALLSTATLSIAADPTFVRHDLAPDSTYSACAALDVNGDGRLDVTCGEWWYEAPTWKRHRLREVEIIRGRYDGYSELPMDVNGDGWSDLISVNYRSRKLAWLEHPGPGLGPWTEHVIGRPGPMETGLLVDIDGDGRVDVLPNGVRFAAWWELTGDPSPSSPPQWLRHDVPAIIGGHGVGFGDINGDGRGDIIGPKGWLEAPPNRRTGTWQWHPEFDLDDGASIPTLAFDVDGDGDTDLVWGRGHRFGLYWLEQVRHPVGRLRGKRGWRRHAIDTSFSQYHALRLTDLNNDGRPEVVAGRRFMGHDGRDPGEYTPLAICAYTYLPASRTWHRNIISFGGRAGFGLDPKAIDLDADGDIDLIGPGRSGLFWFENQLITADRSAATVSAAVEAPPVYADHARLLHVKDNAGNDHPVCGPGDWSDRRAHIVAHIESVMGPLPDPSRRVPLDVQVDEVVQTPEYVRQRLTFAVEPGDRVPAYLLIPADLNGKAPAMLCLHQTSRIGKGEPVGLGGRESLHYADELARRGYVCLVPDYPSFGDYRYDFRADSYASGSIKAIWNNLRAVDLLESLPVVDVDRIGAIGHSLGGHNALFTAVFDPRLRAVVSSCGFTAFAEYYDGNLAGWTSDRYMPRIRDVYGNDPKRMPFDFHEIVAALAPRPVFVNAPLRDANFAVAGVKKVIASAKRVYTLLGADDHLEVIYPDVEHDFSAESRAAAYAWLDRRLANSRRAP